MLKNAPASNTWAAIFKNADFSAENIFCWNWVNVCIFYLKFVLPPLLIVVQSSSVNMERLKDWKYKRWKMTFSVKPN